MDRKKLYLTAAGIGAGLLARSVLRRPTGASLFGKIVLITGATSGLGRTLAREFAAAGCKLALCALAPARLDGARQELEAHFAHVFTVRCDVTNPAQVDGMVETVVERYGRVDILVNNASRAAQGGTLEDLEQAMEAMFWGIVYPTRAVLSHMQEQRAGCIVNITSDGGQPATAHLLPQDCARFAAIGFSEGLRSQLLPQNITVVTVAPAGLSMDESRAARQIVTATERGGVNGLDPGDHAGILPPVSAALDGKSQHRTPAMSLLAMLGRMAASRYL
jgi:NAD(P)-dependent dehydrogenase (short-subunit alcohol dehydrogenase family)